MSSFLYFTPRPPPLSLFSIIFPVPLIPLILFSLPALALGSSVSSSWFHAWLHTCVWLKLCLGPVDLRLVWVGVNLPVEAVRVSQCVFLTYICMNASLQWICHFSSDVKTEQRLSIRGPFHHNSLCWLFFCFKSFSPPVTRTVYYPQQPFSGTMRARRGLPK